MATQIEIQSTNYNGQLAQITFYPCSGGSINLGYQTIPYVYTNDNYEGTYDLYFSAFTKTCQLVISCPTPTPTPTVTSTPTSTPSVITPTPTKSPTPTPTPGGPTTAGVVTSINCGDIDVSGGTFSITYNGNTYPLNTIYSANTLSNLIPISYPAPGVVYDFQFNNDSNYGLCSSGLGFGKYNRIKVTVGPSVGVTIWSSTTQFYSGTTLVYQDTNDNVTLQGSPYNSFGQTYTINISVFYGSLAGFSVNGLLLSDQLNNNITTENDDLLEINS